MLWIGDVGFAGTDTEKLCIKHFNAVKRSGHRNVFRIADFFQGNIGRQKFFFAQSPDRLHSALEVFPELVNVVCPRKPATHSNDRDRLVRVDFQQRIGLHSSSLLAAMTIGSPRIKMLRQRFNGRILEQIDDGKLIWKQLVELNFHAWQH